MFRRTYKHIQAVSFFLHSGVKIKSTEVSFRSTTRIVGVKGLWTFSSSMYIQSMNRVTIDSGAVIENTGCINISKLIDLLQTIWNSWYLERLSSYLLESLVALVCECSFVDHSNLRAFRRKEVVHSDCENLCTDLVVPLVNMRCLAVAHHYTT